MTNKLPQEKANEILNMAIAKVTNDNSSPIEIMVKKLMITRIFLNILTDGDIIGPKNVIEVYRAATDSIDLLLQETLGANEGK